VATSRTIDSNLVPQQRQRGSRRRQRFRIRVRACPKKKKKEKAKITRMQPTRDKRHTKGQMRESMKRVYKAPV